MGMNITIFQYQDYMLIVDCGLAFPDDPMLGIEILIPDLTFLWENQQKLGAIVLTHGHEDHIGALVYLLRIAKIPVYGTPFTLALVKERLQETPLLFSPDFREIGPGDKLNAGPFSLEFINTYHSIPQCVALAMETPVGRIIHSGDFKLDPDPPAGQMTDLERFAHYGNLGVLALLSDSTNAEEAGNSSSEREVNLEMTEIIANAEGRVFISLFASNIHRIGQLIDISTKLGRKVVLDGRSLLANVESATRCGLLKNNRANLAPVEAIEQFPDNKLTVISTGSQGEYRSAIVRMAFGEHRYLKVKENDLFLLSSRVIPGNGKSVNRLVNQLLRAGAKEVILQKMNPRIHASGHAFAGELTTLLKAVKPSYLIPIHGELRQRKRHACLAKELEIGICPLVAENGVPIVFESSGNAYNEEPVTVGHMPVEVRGQTDISSTILRERKQLAFNGAMVCILKLGKKTLKNYSQPEFIGKGIVSPFDNPELFESLEEYVDQELKTIRQSGIFDPLLVHEKVYQAIRRFFRKRFGRKPVTIPVIDWIEE